MLESLVQLADVSPLFFRTSVVSEHHLAPEYSTVDMLMCCRLIFCKAVAEVRRTLLMPTVAAPSVQMDVIVV